MLLPAALLKEPPPSIHPPLLTPDQTLRTVRHYYVLPAETIRTFPPNPPLPAETISLIRSRAPAALSRPGLSHHA